MTMTITTTRSFCRMSHSRSRLYHQLQLQLLRIPDKTKTAIYSHSLGPIPSHDHQFHRAIIIRSSSSSSSSIRRFHYTVPAKAKPVLNSSSELHSYHTSVKPLQSSSSFADFLRRNFPYRNIHSVAGYSRGNTSSLSSNRLGPIITPVRNMSSKHLATGSPCPPLKEGKLRVYNMRYCPFAQRALLVAEAKDIPYDIVNCNLKQKPEFLLEKNPQGEVPVIETNDGKILSESLVVAEYLDEAFPQQRPLQSSDPYKKALDKLYIEKFRSVTLSFYRIIFSIRDSEPSEVQKEKITKFVQALKQFEDELARRGTTFFAGDQPGMLDYMMWPWIERTPILKIKLPDLFDYEEAKRQHPNLENWRQSMKKDKAVSKIFISPEDHLPFVESFLAGTPIYD